MCRCCPCVGVFFIFLEIERFHVYVDSEFQIFEISQIKFQMSNKCVSHRISYVSTYVLKNRFTVSRSSVTVYTMRSVFEIVKVTTIEDDSISSVASSSNARVYIGTNNGTLMVYELRHRDGDVGIVDEDVVFFISHDVNKKTEQI